MCVCLFYRKIKDKKVPAKKKMTKNPKPVEPIGQRILVRQIVRVNRKQIQKQRYCGHLNIIFTNMIRIKFEILHSLIKYLTISLL